MRCLIKENGGELAKKAFIWDGNCCLLIINKHRCASFSVNLLEIFSELGKLANDLQLVFNNQGSLL